MEPIDFSIVVPNRNGEKYIGETIRSIQSQVGVSIEVLVIDGASNDNSMSIVNAFGDAISWAVSEPDRGQSEAINKGLRRARGTWVAYLNSDDVYLPGALAAVKSAAQHTKAQVIVGTCIFFGEEYPTTWVRSSPSQHTSDWILANQICQPSTFWRRSLVEEIGLFDESFHYCMDYEYWLRILTAGRKFQFVDLPLSGFRLHPTSKTVAQAERFAAEEERIRERYVSELVEGERARLQRIRRGAELLNDHELIRAKISRGDRANAWSHFLSCTRHNPASVFCRLWAGTALRLAGLR